jgi:hypothetical protein
MTTQNESSKTAKSTPNAETASATQKSSTISAGKSGPNAMSYSSESFVHETQSERWLKYGSNVAAVSAIVILIALAVIFLADLRPKRFDTTLGGEFSLKPQTLNVIHNLKDKITIVSLLTRSKPAESDADSDQPASAASQLTPDERIQQVDDILQEYANNSPKISVQSIDPNATPNKVEDLIASVTKKYGGEVAKYKAFIDGFGDKYNKLKAIADAEVAKVEQLPLDKINSEELEQSAGLAILSVREVPEQLGDLTKKIQKPLKQNPPDYKGAADSLTNGMDVMSQLLGPVIDSFKKLKDNPSAPPEIRAYMTGDLPQYQQMKDIADGVVKEGNALGELKLDTLRTSLHVRDPILVMGENDWRVLTPQQLWETYQRDLLGRTTDKPRPRFSGEQQITGAILALSTPKKPMVVFCRTSGGPLTSPGFPPYEPSGPFAAAAERLQAYNFDVQEKDLSGMSAMQAEQQGEPPPPEPSDADMNAPDVTWVVLAASSQQQQSDQGPPPSVAGRVAEHLRAGGSVLLLVGPQTEDCAEALDGWGVSVKPNLICVHEPVKPPEGTDGTDIVAEALRQPIVFKFTEYGDQPLAKPLTSLTSLMGYIVPVQTHDSPGVTSAPLLPIPGPPAAPKSWASANFDLQNQDQPLTFQPDKGDLPGPIYAGATAEKAGGGRLVVIGTPSFLQSSLLQARDAAQNNALIFPGNGELFANCVFWLAHKDDLLAISPSAMDVSRVADMSRTTLALWRATVLLLMPGAVVLAGVLVYMSRRD